MISDIEQNLAIIIFDTSFNIVELSQKAHEDFNAFCNDSFFKNLFTGYEKDKFKTAFSINISVYLNCNISLVFNPIDNNFIKCQIVPAQDYANFSGHSALPLGVQSRARSLACTSYYTKNITAN